MISSAVFSRCSDVYQLNLQLTRDWRRNALRLRIKREITLAGEHWLSQSFQNNYSPMCPRLFLRCLETPKPDAEIDVVFGFLLKVGHTRLRFGMNCTLKLHTVPLFVLFNYVSCCSLATEYLWPGTFADLKHGLNSATPQCCTVWPMKIWTLWDCGWQMSHQQKGSDHETLGHCTPTRPQCCRIFGLHVPMATIWPFSFLLY